MIYRRIPVVEFLRAALDAVRERTPPTYRAECDSCILALPWQPSARLAVDGARREGWTVGTTAPPVCLCPRCAAR